MVNALSENTHLRVRPEENHLMDYLARPDRGPDHFPNRYHLKIIYNTMSYSVSINMSNNAPSLGIQEMGQEINSINLAEFLEITALKRLGLYETAIIKYPKLKNIFFTG